LNRRATAQEQVELTIVDRDQYDALIGEHRGKVVLVDFWATWCLPCIEQLPHTIELAERLGPRGLEVVTMSFDDPVEKQHVADLLRSKQAGRLTNLISQYGGGPQSMTAFEIESGAVPHYKLYDRAGRLRHTFELDPLAREQFTPQEIDAAVEQLLAE
jgi:thiol-disulfide isomerase/thioredoxin